MRGFPGSYDLCEVCFWEDDAIQLLDPSYGGGANQLSLVECQANFQRFGACEERFIQNVRPPTRDEEHDPEWRPVREGDLMRARRPIDLSEEEAKRLDVWYYWKMGSV